MNDSMSIEKALQDIQDVYFNAGARVSVDTYDRTHATLTAVAEEAKREERKECARQILCRHDIDGDVC